MEKKHREILVKKSVEISENISLEDIKPLLMSNKMFNKYMWEDIKCVSDVFHLLPTRGPDAFKNMIKILRKTNYHDEADMLDCKCNTDLIYKIPANPNGWCLLINNVKFRGSEERIGSDIDAVSLIDFFEKINYKVNVKDDLSARKMKDCLLSFAKSDFTKTDVVIVIILSHGLQENNEDLILGIDEVSIGKKEITDIFNNKQCIQMQGKPKVFFFVCCRGRGRDYGIERLCPSESTDSVKIGPPAETLPTPSDILIVHSSLPNTVSVRIPELGTWFCQDLISVLKEHYLELDLEDMMKIVNSKLIKRVSKLCLKQAAHVENLAFKKLWLCGKPENV